MVHSTAEERQALPQGGMSADGDGTTNSEGWVVTRRFKDFETLHVKLKEVLKLKKKGTYSAFTSLGQATGPGGGEGTPFVGCKRRLQPKGFHVSGV